MQLIPQDENKRRRLYHVCRSGLFFCGLIFVVLFAVTLIFLRHLYVQRLLAFCCIIVLVLTVIVWHLANKLDLIVGSKKDPPELPYKPKREQGYLVMVFGCIVMGSISILAQEPSRSYLFSTLMVITVNNQTTLIVPVWLKSVIGLSVLYSVLYLWSNDGRVILDRDFFRYHTYLKKHQMAYADIEQAEISKGYDGTNGARAFMDIYSRKSTTPIRINLGSISGADVAIILKVIHQQEPRAKMNEVAERIRKGEFPIS